MNFRVSSARRPNSTTTTTAGTSRRTSMSKTVITFSQENVGAETEAPRRASRSRKLPCWLRSPSPTPLSAQRRSSSLDDAQPARQPHVKAELSQPDSSTPISTDTGDSKAEHSALGKSSVTNAHETGPGKRLRRPSSMYKPPEALTADAKRTSSPKISSKLRPGSASTPSSTSRPRIKQSVKSENDAHTPSPPRITLRFPTRSAPPPSADELRTPPTFTRRGERFTEPLWRRDSNISITSHCSDDLAGIMSPKPVRTAAGVCRVGSAPMSDYDEDEDEDEPDDVDELVRNALHVEFAERAWSASVQEAQGIAGDAHCSADGDDEDDNDFHQTMLHDAELDMLTRTDSPHGSDDVSPLTDGHVTTPASCAAKDSPSGARSCSPLSDAAKDSIVFAHALPVPHSRTSESGAHAGSLTLSLPYQFTAGVHAAQDQHETSLSSPILDASGDTPLTPVRTVTAPETAEQSLKKDDNASVCSMPPLAAPSLPSDLSRVSPTVMTASSDAVAAVESDLSAPVVDVHYTTSPSGELDSVPDAPLLDDAFESSDKSPTPQEDIIPKSEAWLNTDASMLLPLQDDADMDPLFSAPEKIMALTDLDRAWGWLDNLETSCPPEDRKRLAHSSTFAQSKRQRTSTTSSSAQSSASSCTTQPPRSRLLRLRSRAL